MTSCGSGPTGARPITCRVTGSTITSVCSRFESASSVCCGVDWATTGSGAQIKPARVPMKTHTSVHPTRIVFLSFSVGYHTLGRNMTEDAIHQLFLGYSSTRLQPLPSNTQQRLIHLTP